MMWAALDDIDQNWSQQFEGWKTHWPSPIPLCWWGYSFSPSRNPLRFDWSNGRTFHLDVRTVTRHPMESLGFKQYSLRSVTQARICDVRARLTAGARACWQACANSTDTILWKYSRAVNPGFICATQFEEWSAFARWSQHKTRRRINLENTFSQFDGILTASDCWISSDSPCMFWHDWLYLGLHCQMDSERVSPFFLN
jgi:hypothetical protein